MKRKRIKSSDERLIITGAIVSTNILAVIKRLHDPYLVESKVMSTIIQWCVDYFEDHQEAPNRHIQDIFQRNKRSLDEDTSDVIKDLLISLNKEFERSDSLNESYIIKATEDYYATRKLRVTAEDILVHLDNYDLNEALNTVVDYEIADSNIGDFVNVFSEEGLDKLQEAFLEAEEPLFRFPGVLGKNLINEFLVPQGFIAFQGPEKIGKTWMLMKCALLACRKRNNTVLFQVGDMSEKEQLMRMGISICGKSNKAKYTGEQTIPYVDRRGSDPITITKQEDLGSPLTFSDILKSKRFKKYKDRLRMATYPNSTVNVKDLEAHLNKLKVQDGFVPKVIVVDYADILAPMPGNKEFRHQQHQTWMALRALAQKWNCLVITATQADIKAVGKIQNRSNFSEDKRKYSHATALFTLNQIDELLEYQIQVGCLFVRSGERPKCIVNVVQSLKQGNPVVDSYLRPMECPDEATEEEDED